MANPWTERVIVMKRKDKTKHSFFTASIDGVLSTVATYLLVFVLGYPAALIFMNAEKLGILWLPVLLLHSAFLICLSYIFVKYRALQSVRAHFREEEYKELYPDDYNFLKAMDRVSIVDKLLNR